MLLYLFSLVSVPFCALGAPVPCCGALGAPVPCCGDLGAPVPCCGDLGAPVPWFFVPELAGVSRSSSSPQIWFSSWVRPL
ncbi:hypothetical protein HYE05_03950 [Mycoplasmopsis bovis]|nr:hypothetical protein [Mycoplasmopsis bovis]QQH27672.1 hypothetical protein HYE05_03950 [Mycoplasmopsis bovis]